MPTNSLPSLEGKVAIVTGANTGIGRVTARELARAGAKVWIACRSRDKAQPVLDEIGAKAVFLPLDLSDLDSVRAGAATFLASGDPLHILVDNAGVAGQRGITKQGFELEFGVNHLGHFLFTNLLVDKLKASAPSRVVLVSSEAHYRPKRIPWDRLRERTPSITGLPEYGVSKLANVLYGAELARRLEGTGVTTYSLHPGVIASDAWRRMPWPVRPVIKAFMKSTEEGAATSLRCATDPSLAAESGKFYWSDGKEKRPSRIAQDAALAAELWKRSEEWVSGARA